MLFHSSVVEGSSAASTVQDVDLHHKNVFESLWKKVFQQQQKQQQQKQQKQKHTAKQQQQQPPKYHTHLRKHLFEHAISNDPNYLEASYLYNVTFPTDRTSSLFAGLPAFSSARKLANMDKIRELFYHGYSHYMQYAYPSGEIRPISCVSHEFDLVPLPALTLLDSLDTLLLFQNHTEFARSVERLRLLYDTGFDFDETVSVFETNIRILGGLLSAHQLAILPQHSHRVPQDVVWDNTNRETILESYGPDTCDMEFNSTTVFWEYDNLLLELAVDLGNRLLPAFDTPTGIPYGTVHLQTGVPEGETPVASLAGAGTLCLEFTLLSELTGNPSYGSAARLAMRALFARRSSLDLFGKHIDTASGQWTETLSGIGSNSDSYLEYLAKHYFLFHDDDFWTMLKTSYAGVYNESRLGEWYVDVDMNYGISSGNGRTVLESLAAFYPGLQVLLGEYTPASRSLNSYLLVREILGFLPERFHYGAWNIDRGAGAAKHPLRPELLESVYWMHRSTKNDGWAWAADFALHQLESVTKTTCGFASLNEVHPHQTGKVGGGDDIKLMDEMPSFFLSETLKYLYLTFDDDNVMHTDDRQWIFTTEAHPIHRPKPKGYRNEIETLREILEGRLNKQDDYVMRRYSLSSAALQSKEEKWTEKTSYDMLRNDIDRLEWKQHRINATNEELTDIVPAGRYYRNHFGERNLAHLSLNDQGSGAHLNRQCPNMHRSELLWTRALTGGSLDYADIYVSSTNDKLIEQGIRYHLLGASEAQAIQGNGVYYGEKENADLLCRIVKEDPQESVVKKSTENPKVDSISNDGVMVLPSDMGNFEVAAFQDGSGFFIRHVESGEQIKTNILFDEGDTQEHVALVHSKLRTGSESVEGVDDAEVNSQQQYRRTVTLSDFRDNVFSCQVKLFRTDDPEDHDSAFEEMLTVPCSPALFGPTLISNLQKLDSIVSESVLVGPSHQSLLGCNEPLGKGLRHDFVYDVVLPTHTQRQGRCGLNLSHLLHRGECSFFTKAINMSRDWEAETMIIVNASNDLFMMSASSDEIMSSFPTEMPVSVLIARDDGIAAQKALKEASNAGKTVVSRVEVLRESNSVEMPFKDVDIGATIPHWPVVQASSDQLSIFAEYGWGISATQHIIGDAYEWQLQLLRHGQ